MNTILKINLLLIFLFRIGLGIQVPQDPKINKYLMSVVFDYQLFNEIPLFSVDPKVNQNYQKLIYGEGFPNIQSFLEYRALMISRFLIEGYTMAIPEYIVVVNRCIEHINKTIKNIEYYDGECKTQNLNFRLSV